MAEIPEKVIWLLDQLGREFLQSQGIDQAASPYPELSGDDRGDAIRVASGWEPPLIEWLVGEKPIVRERRQRDNPEAGFRVEMPDFQQMIVTAAGRAALAAFRLKPTQSRKKQGPVPQATLRGWTEALMEAYGQSADTGSKKPPSARKIWDSLTPTVKDGYEFSTFTAKTKKTRKKRNLKYAEDVKKARTPQLSDGLDKPDK